MKKKILLKFVFVFGMALLVGCGDKKDNSWGDEKQELGSINQEATDKESIKEETKNESQNSQEVSDSEEESSIKEETQNSQNNIQESKIDFEQYKGKTIADLIKDINTLEDRGYMSSFDEYVFYFTNKDERFSLTINATCDEEKVEALGDFLDRETEDLYPLANIISIEYIDNEAVLEEVQKYVGLKVKDMVNDGYEINGYASFDDEVTLSLQKENGPSIDVYIGKIENFDSDHYEDLYLDVIIEDISINTYGF